MQGRLGRVASHVSIAPGFEMMLGNAPEQLLDAYPRLTREAIQAALGFAAEALRADVVYPFARTE